MAVETKEVLVIYEGRLLILRSVVLPPFKDANSKHIGLLDAVKHAFSDLIDSHEGSSSQSISKAKEFLSADADTEL